MPYDPRQISEGGNKGIDETFSRKAPAGKFRVIGVDMFDGGDWCECDLGSLAEAKEYIRAQTVGKQMLKYHVYDDSGKHVSEAGSF